MKLRKKIVIGASLISILGIFLFMCKSNTLYNKLEKNNIENEIESGIAVYVANDTDYVRVDTIPESGYIFNEELSYCNESEVKNDNIKISYDMDIKMISITPVANEKTKCYLYFDVQKTAEEQILANVTVNSGTPDFSKTSCTNGCGEATVGVYATEDGMYGGTSYYWRGDTEDNYVTFGGYCWRIVRINGDGSLRLIYDGTTCHANGTSTKDSLAVISAYSSSDDSSVYVGWSYTLGQQHGTGTASYARTQVESWYNTNLANYKDYIADGKYCNDRSVGSGTWSSTGITFYYAAYTRLVSAKTPTLSCATTSDVFTLKVGLITADEVAYVGGVWETNNQSYYLYNGCQYWTMTPYYWLRNGTTFMYSALFSVNSDGLPNHYYVSNTYGLRPVINLKADITFSSGNGTQSTPYVVKMI